MSPPHIVTLSFLFALILYWPTLKLPLIYDTLLHIRIAGNLTLKTVWLPTDAFGFYRPLTFLPLILIKEIYGYFPGWLLHGLNVGQHALNAGLVAGLSWRLWRRWDWAVSAGILFALFPFSYQAVAVYGHNVHPVTAGLMLLALHSYLWWRATNDELPIIHYPLSIIHSYAPLLLATFFLLALLSHESAILLGVFVILVEMNLSPIATLREERRRLLPGFLLTGLGVVYAGIYQLLPISRAPQAAADGGGGLSKLLYLSQAFAHPFTWFAHVFSDLSAVTIISWGVILTAILLILAMRIADNRCPLLLGLGWFFLSALLIAIPLPAGYLLHGPRLLYLGSIGLAVIWPILIVPDSGKTRIELVEIRWFRPLVFIRALFFLFILVTNWLFVRDRLHAYQELTQPVMVAQDALSDRENAGILFVNLPQWIAPPRNTYAVGSEFTSMLGGYLFVEELARANGLPSQTFAVEAPDLLTDFGYGYGIHQQNGLGDVPLIEATQVLVTSFGENGMEVENAGILHPAKPDSSAIGQFGNKYKLRAAQATLCHDLLEIELTWQPLKPIATTTIFVQIFNAKNELAGQMDGAPLRLRPDLLSLPSYIEIVDKRQLALMEPATTILLGVYDYSTGERFAATDRQGNPFPDNAFSLPIAICNPK